MIHTDSREPHVPRDFKLVAKIALSVSLAACIGLLLILQLLSEERGTSYGHVITAYDLARQNLHPAVFALTLALVIVAGIITWLFALYSSFRIAGPLVRIARNLEDIIDRGPIELVPIRKTDRLQREWAPFDASVTALRAHYAEFEQALAETRTALQHGARDNAQLQQAIARLKYAERNVRL